MALDPTSGENPEDEALDELLLLLLAGRGEPRAEVFRERRSRVQLALEFGPDGSRHQPPLRRDDEGTALRRVGPEGVRAGHVSGAGAEALRSLAQSLSRASEAEPACAAAPAAPLELEREGKAARLLDEAAAFLRHEAEREPRLHRAGLTIRREERRVHVVSSEWGQASDSRRSWRLEYELELIDESGRRARARRACGWSGREPGRGLGALVDELFACADAAFEAGPVPEAAPPIVLAAGGGAVLFHEAVGHALEGDVSARVGTVLSGLTGRRVAPAELSVIDDPTIPGRAGSAAHDDEGVVGRAVALIEEGRIGQPLRDGLRCDFDRSRATGHGRRASHRVPPLPRMTNTFLVPGDLDLAEVLAPVRRGILIERLERGSFDPATGAFRLRVSEARLIEGGRPGRALRPFDLEGDTLGLLAGVEAIGGELGWDDGCGTCGRDGQWLPVSAGCPALRLAEGTLRVR